MDSRVKFSLVHHSSFELLLKRLVFESPQVCKLCCSLKDLSPCKYLSVNAVVKFC